jgi:anti-sigma regulatory factor (Ser/Thr protein kinase)
VFDFDVSLPADARAPAAARRALEGMRPSLDRRAFEETMLLVSELVTNSVRHARLSANESIELRVRVDTRQVHVAVTDSGPGFDPDTAGPARNLEAGWGLTLLRRIAARWGIHRNDETTVWFEVARDTGLSA